MQPALLNKKLNRFVPFAYGFRPFFLLAGWFALVGIGAWMWMYYSGWGPLPGLPAQLWHGHEMLYGFVPAAIAGFMLTAVPSWTGSRGFGGAPLVLLTLAWLLGRIGFAFAGALPFYMLVIFELAFLPLVSALIAPPLWRSRNRNRPLLLVLFVLWACDAVFLLALRAGDAVLAVTALRTTLNVVLLLITVIGGRIVPAFTGNALRGSGIEVSMPDRPWLERAVIALMAAVLVVDASATAGCGVRSAGGSSRTGPVAAPGRLAQLEHPAPAHRLGIARRLCLAAAGLAAKSLPPLGRIRLGRVLDACLGRRRRGDHDRRGDVARFPGAHRPAAASPRRDGLVICIAGPGRFGARVWPGAAAGQLSRNDHRGGQSLGCRLLHLCRNLHAHPVTAAGRRQAGLADCCAPRYS